MKQKNTYEIVVVVDANLTDEESRAILNRHKEIITNAGGDIKFENTWGRRKLAYEINKMKHGIYFLLWAEGDGSTIEEMARQFGYDDKIIKFFVVMVDDLKEAHAGFEALKANPQINANLVSEKLGA